MIDKKYIDLILDTVDLVLLCQYRQEPLALFWMRKGW